MENMIIVLWLIFTAACWIIYHKIFTVYYFSLSRGILQEIFICAIVGAALMAVTLRFWIVTALIAIITGLAAKKKINSPAPLIAAAIIVIFVAFVGISLNSATAQTTSLNIISLTEI